MATLEKIRSKSVILFVIIIVALLAFILGDFLTSGRTYFGTGDKMIEANGAQVKLNDLNAFRESRVNAREIPTKSTSKTSTACLFRNSSTKNTKTSESTLPTANSRRQ